MKDKHYTPEIEDFHFGFEFEMYGNEDNNLPEREWHKMIYGKGGTSFQESPNYAFSSSYSNSGYIDSDMIRVKYLDRSDIEELGWKFLSEYSDEDKEVMTFQKGNWVLVYNFTIKKIFIFVKDYSEEHDLFGSARDVKISGLEVKNKSELKRLIRNLKMGE